MRGGKGSELSEGIAKEAGRGCTLYSRTTRQGRREMGERSKKLIVVNSHDNRNRENEEIYTKKGGFDSCEWRAAATSSTAGDKGEGG